MKKSWWDESGGVSFSNRFASSCMLCFILRISADSLWFYTDRHTSPLRVSALVRRVCAKPQPTDWGGWGRHGLWPSWYPSRPQTITTTRYTMTATAVKTWKTNGVLLRNRQNHLTSLDKLSLIFTVCGRHCNPIQTPTGRLGDSPKLSVVPQSCPSHAHITEVKVKGKGLGTCYSDRSFAAAGPRLWNSLPGPLRQSETIATFKRHLRTFLYSY